MMLDSFLTTQNASQTIHKRITSRRCLCSLARILELRFVQIKITYCSLDSSDEEPDEELLSPVFVPAVAPLVEVVPVEVAVAPVVVAPVVSLVVAVALRFVQFEKFKNS